MIEMTDELVRKYEGLIIQEVNKYYSKQDTDNTWRVSKDDLIQEAYLAMAAACKQFDPDKGYQFSTYLVPVIDRALMCYYRKVSRPFSVTQDQNRIYVGIDKGIKEGKSVEEIAEENGIKQEKVIEFLSLNTNAYSLDYTITDEKGGKDSNFSETCAMKEQSPDEKSWKDKLEIMAESLQNNKKVTAKDKEYYYRTKGLFGRTQETIKQLADDANISVHKFRVHMQAVASILEHDIKKDIWKYEHIGY